MINFSKLAALAKATPSELAQSTSADALAQEKLTRRAALRRIGMTGAMTVLGVLSIDELARVAAKKLDEHEMTRGLAKDFRDAGVAFADTTSNNEGYGGGGNPCRTQAGMDYSSCMGDAAIQLTKAIQSSGVAGAIGLIGAIGNGSFDPNALTGPLGQAYSNYSSAMDKCKSKHDASVTQCASNPNQAPLPFDPTTCQDAVDQNLINTLKGKLASDPRGAAKALKDALAACDLKCHNTSDLSQCYQDAVSSNVLPNGGQAVSPLAVKTYLECSYIACDSQIGPKDPRNQCKLA